MIIRRVISRDRNRILEMLSQRGVFSKKEIRVGMEVFDAALTQAGSEEYLAFGACRENNDELVGYICFGPITVTDDCYDLYWLVVDEKHSRKGIAEKLLIFMEEMVSRKGVRRMYVDTSSTAPYDAARAFYEKHGYQPSYVITDFYRMGDHKVIYTKNMRKNAAVAEASKSAALQPAPA